MGAIPSVTIVDYQILSKLPELAVILYLNAAIRLRTPRAYRQQLLQSPRQAQQGNRRPLATNRNQQITLQLRLPGLTPRMLQPGNGRRKYTSFKVESLAIYCNLYR